MKIIIIGATGTIGSAVFNLLSKDHQVVGASRSSDLVVDLQKPNTFSNIFKQHKDVGAIMCVAGNAVFGQFDSLTDKEINFGITNKLLGQIKLVRFVRKNLGKNVVTVLTTGILAQNPNFYSSMLTMINRGLEGFVEAVSLDMPKNQKIHAVSPPLIKETAEKMGWEHGGVSASDIAKLYGEALTSTENGKIFSYQKFR